MSPWPGKDSSAPRLRPRPALRLSLPGSFRGSSSVRLLPRAHRPGSFFRFSVSSRPWNSARISRARSGLPVRIENRYGLGNIAPGIALACRVQLDPLKGAGRGLVRFACDRRDAQPVAARVHDRESPGGSLLSTRAGDPGDPGHREPAMALLEPCRELVEKPSAIGGQDDEAAEPISGP